MLKTCFLSPLAENDVDEIITYLAEENPTTAHKFLDALFDAMGNLAEHPEMGHVRDAACVSQLHFNKLCTLSDVVAVAATVSA